MAQANNRPLQSTSEGAALLSQINANIGAYRNAAGVLDGRRNAAAAGRKR